MWPNHTLYAGFVYRGQIFTKTDVQFARKRGPGKMISTTKSRDALKRLSLHPSKLMTRDEMSKLDDLDSKGFSQLKQVLVAGYNELGVGGQSTSQENIVFGIPGARFPKRCRLDHKRIFLDPG